MITIKAGTAACEYCGKVEELRPYGQNGEWICFGCGMKDEKTTAARFAAMLDVGLTIDTTDQAGPPALTVSDK